MNKRLKHLQFASAYREQVALDRAAGRDNFAESGELNRRKHQRALADIRKARAESVN